MTQTHNLPIFQAMEKKEKKEKKKRGEVISLLITFLIILTVYLLFKCRSVAWQRDYPKNLQIVSVS